VPEPLRSYLGAPLDQLCWRPLTRDVGQVDLHLGRGPVRTQLIRIRAGAAAPRHSHTGHELTLVLAGGFQDYRGRFKRGDMVVDDATVDHRPVAEAETDCLCLTVIDAPLKLTGGLMRLFNPLLQLRARA
jgi:putative transcriptional regulator